MNAFRKLFHRKPKEPMYKVPKSWKIYASSYNPSDVKGIPSFYNLSDGIPSPAVQKAFIDLVGGSKVEVVEALCSPKIKNYNDDITLVMNWSGDEIEDIVVSGASGKIYRISMNGYGEGVRVFIDDSYIGIGG
jgi:hypothetical protein